MLVRPTLAELVSRAEGIEEQVQLDRLRRLRCRYGQGFYFSPPLPAGEIDEFLARPLVA